MSPHIEVLTHLLRKTVVGLKQVSAKANDHFRVIKRT